VPDEAGDLLDGDPLVAHQADERGPQLAWGPVIVGVGLGADASEHLPDVSGVQCGAVAGGEDQPGVLPVVPGGEPLIGLAAGPGAQRLDGGGGEGEGAAGPLGLGLPVRAD
jgi:hypothetical protein